MAFITCESCGKKTTDKREKCPECGQPVKSETEKRWEKNEAAFKVDRTINPADKNWIRCPQCEYQGEAVKHTPGNFLIEVVLWLFFLNPGLIYSIWRLANRGQMCPACEWTHVVKIAPIYDGQAKE